MAESLLRLLYITNDAQLNAICWAKDATLKGFCFRVTCIFVLEEQREKFQKQVEDT